MQLQLFKPMWGFNGSMKLAIEQLLSANMQGLEGPAPDSTKECLAMKGMLEQNSLAYIAEICTAGNYVPERQATLQQHLDSLDKKLQLSIELNPLFITCLGGCDAWPENQSVEFFQGAMDLAKTYDTTISFETHRSRSLFNPWITQRIVQQLPDIPLTVDFSHWCVVCERLMDSEIDIIHSIADKVHHIHARVGYEQGPQVPDPRAPEFTYALRAHQHWWEIIWQSQLKRHTQYTTMTPEFGPDGYLHEQPFTRTPVADLWELNCWMAEEEDQHFAKFISDKKY